MRHAVLSASLITIALAALPARAEAATDGAPVRCENLKQLSTAHTTIIRAEIVPAGTFRAPETAEPGPPVDFSRLPAFCRVVGSIKPTFDSDIRFEMWLPESGWNGKFLQEGNGGAAGSIAYFGLVTPLAMGYAVANTDMGHRGSGDDFSWAVGHPERLKDFSYRATHEVTIAAKAITARRFGRTPDKSYWEGCSTGGRQGLKEAQLYPDDYDAIIAGAPASNWTPLMALGVLIQRNMTEPGGLGVEKLPLLKEAALRACDALDGVVDRVITEPRRCDFRPRTLLCASGAAADCLSASEVAAVERIYRGVVSSDGTVRIPGTGPGSEAEWAAYAGPFRIGSKYFKYVVASDSQADPVRTDVDALLARARQLTFAAPDAMSPDLSRFFKRGGKLITYHGTTDGLIPFGNSVNYHESLIAKLGGSTVERSARFFPMPGMTHCSFGEGAFVIDWLTALDGWVSTGRAPDVLPATHPAGQSAPPWMPPLPLVKAFSRPVCAYPKVARYAGTGDTADASSFVCAAP